MNTTSIHPRPLLLACLFATATFAGAEELRTFKRIQLHDQFWSEGATFGDLNKDGKNDIIAGPWWWEGPDFTKRHEYAPATQTFELALGPQTKVTVPGFEGALGRQNTYSQNFFAYTYDFNKDGWNDILIIGFPGQDTSWFENPKGNDSQWTRHKIFDQTDNESPTFADITGDGKPELVCITKGQYGYATPDAVDAAKPWTFHAISPDNKYGNFTHGMGLGDVNGDGRLDLLEKDGWWEQPASLAGDPLWTQHKSPFGGGGAQMYAYDVNGDGLNDVITSLAAHGFGLSWFEQYREGNDIKFREHLLVGKDPAESKYGIKFSEIHAIDLVDMDGDGLKDIVTGKRFWSHGRTGDPDRNNDAVLYWFKLVRGSDKSVEFIPYLIDNNCGVGTQVVAGDINGDGLPDVVVGNKKGAIIELQEKKTVSKEEWEKAQPKPLKAPGNASAVPASADLRASFERWQLPLRKQGRRDTCSVFATVGAMEYAVARKLGHGIPLSVEFLNWAGDRAIQRAQDGHFFSSVIRGYEAHGICAEEDMPYARKFQADYQPSEKAIATAQEMRKVGLQFHWLRPNDRTKGLTDEHIAKTKEVLAAGWPVAAGSYHSILFVGYTDDPALEGGGQFFVRDSGGNNEQTLTYAAAKARMCDLFWVESEAATGNL
jgi:hypothetical protein